MSTSSTPQEQFGAAWMQVAQAINALSPAQRAALKETIRHFNHDLGDRAGLVRSAEALLRREAAQPCDMELLDIIRQAAQDLMALIQVLREFAQAIEG